MGANERRGLSLGTKLIAATTLLLAVAVGTAAFYSLRTLNDLAKNNIDHRRAAGHKAMNERTELLVQNLALAYAQLAARGEYSILGPQLEATKRQNETIGWIMVSDSADVVLATTPGAPHNKDATIDSDPITETLRADKLGSAVHRFVDPKDEQQFVFAANLIVQDTQGDEPGKRQVERTYAGQLRLSMSTAKFEKQLADSLAAARARARASARNQLLFAGLALILGILLSLFQATRITRPLKILDRTAEAIASGDFDRRVDVKTGDEIGHLADSFNSMAESLGTLVQTMAEKASLERELELARSVQEVMSPPPVLHEVGPFALAGRCEMAEECGGDWWSFHELGNDRLLIVVGDVTGHGMPAAMIAATARGAVEAFCLAERAEMSPAAVLEAMDRAIRDVGRNQLLMTCFALLLDPHAGYVEFANAGHCFPYVLQASDSGKKRSRPGVLAVRGNPLGNEVRVIRSNKRPWHPGDVVVLTTDGVADRIDASGERFGDNRLRKLLMDHDMEDGGDGVIALRDRIVQTVDAFGGSTPADDDMTLIVCRMSAEWTASTKAAKQAGSAATS